MLSVRRTYLINVLFKTKITITITFIDIKEDRETINVHREMDHLNIQNCKHSQSNYRDISFETWNGFREKYELGGKSHSSSKLI